MKGNWPGFSNSGGGGNNSSGNGEIENEYVNGQDYNTAGSNSVKQVYSVTTLSNAHSMPISSVPNSVTKNYRDGKLSTERYFDESGNPYLDIDYSNHGNPSTHPIVPHEHDITFDDSGKMHRGKGKGINND